MKVRSSLYRQLDEMRWRLRDPEVLEVRRLEEKSQWWSAHEIKTMQDDAVRRLIEHVYRHVPYYRKLMISKHLTPEDIKTTEDLVKLPVLTKQTLSSRWEEFLPERLDSSRVAVRRTGGTTGQPLRIARDSRGAAFENAAFYRGLGFAGYRQGEAMAKLFGGSLGMAPVGSLQRAKAWFSGEIFLPAFEVSRENAPVYVHTIRRGHARFLRGFASAIHLLAVSMKDRNLALELDAVFSTSDMLYEPQREVIAERLGQVFEYYGCGEVNSIAFECSAHNGLHVSDEHVLLEALKDGVPVGEGEAGAATLTTLRNYTMPLIRYQNGDIVTLTKRPCPCGRGLSRIEKLLGRTNDLLRAQDGRLISGVFLPAFLVRAEMSGVSQVQVIQESADWVRVLVVASAGYCDDSLVPLRELLVRYLGRIRIDVEEVATIPTAPSGKRQYVISKLG